MLAVLLSILLAVVPAVVPAPNDACFALPSVVSAAPFGADSVLFFHYEADGGMSTTLVPLTALRVMTADVGGGEGGCVNLPGGRNVLLNPYGWPLLGTSNGSSSGAGPHVLETTYTSNSGSHTVRTPCSSYNSVDDCANRHKAAVEALQRVYPRL